MFGADHIYRMDAAAMVDAHIKAGVGVTVAGIRVPVEQASSFGVIQLGVDGLIEAFHEKPTDPPALDDDPRMVLASMGNYVFTTDALIDAVTSDAQSHESAHDMGGNIVVDAVARGDAAVYDFSTGDVPGSTERDRNYWRDVGTIDAYYDAHMDLISVDPVFNLYNDQWPIYTWLDPLPPAKFVFDDEGRRGTALASMVSSGVIVSGGTVRGSVLSPGVRVHSYAKVENSVLLHDVQVGRDAVVRRAIIDKNVLVPPGARIGVDPDWDRQHFHVSDNGVVVIGKDDQVPYGP